MRVIIIVMVCFLFSCNGINTSYPKPFVINYIYYTNGRITIQTSEDIELLQVDYYGRSNDITNDNQTAGTTYFSNLSMYMEQSNAIDLFDEVYFINTLRDL